MIWSFRQRREQPDRGATAVEYGLLVAAVMATFMGAAIGLQAVAGVVFDQAVTAVEQDDSR